MICMVNSGVLEVEQHHTRKMSLKAPHVHVLKAERSVCCFAKNYLPLEIYMLTFCLVAVAN
jgi:tRNA-binding EMAP/Myf-like protein